MVQQPLVEWQRSVVLGRYSLCLRPAILAKCLAVFGRFCGFVSGLPSQQDILEFGRFCSFVSGLPSQPDVLQYLGDFVALSQACHPRKTSWNLGDFVALSQACHPCPPSQTSWNLEDFMAFSQACHFVMFQGFIGNGQERVKGCVKVRAPLPSFLISRSLLAL